MTLEIESATEDSPVRKETTMNDNLTNEESDLLMEMRILQADEAFARLLFLAVQQSEKAHHFLLSRNITDMCVDGRDHLVNMAENIATDPEAAKVAARMLVILANDSSIMQHLGVLLAEQGEDELKPKRIKIADEKFESLRKISEAAGTKFSFISDWKYDEFTCRCWRSYSINTNGVAGGGVISLTFHPRSTEVDKVEGMMEPARQS